jgi:hypothetical protein
MANSMGGAPRQNADAPSNFRIQRSALRAAADPVRSQAGESNGAVRTSARFAGRNIPRGI